MKKVIFGIFGFSSLLAAPYTPVPSPDSTMSTIQTTDENPKDHFSTTGDQKLGSQIRQQIADIVGAPKAAGVNLVIDEGDVKLIGKVDTEDTKRKIVQGVHQVKGVKSVHNQLETEKKPKNKKPVTGKNVKKG